MKISNQVNWVWDTCQNFRVFHQMMGAKFSVYPRADPDIGLIVIFLLGFVVRWICLNGQAATGIIYNREHCPICLNEFTAPIRVNCGHAFCMECLLNYFTTNPTMHNCPVCRNFVQHFESLNKFSFEAKDCEYEVRLEQQLRDRISQENIYKAMNLQQKRVILFMIIYLFCHAQYDIILAGVTVLNIVLVVLILNN